MTILECVDFYIYLLVSNCSHDAVFMRDTPYLSARSFWKRYEKVNACTVQKIRQQSDNTIQIYRLAWICLLINMVLNMTKHEAPSTV